jgi:hypothetical protein
LYDIEKSNRILIYFKIIDMNFKDYNEKWYFLGTVVGIFAGIFLGWLMFA